MVKKAKINDYYYNEIIKYLEDSFGNYKFTDSLRDNYVKEFIIKYIRVLKSIKLLDLNGFHHECDILIRTLDEMIIDLAYLELDSNNYIRYDLYVNYQLYDLINEKCEIDDIDINEYPEIDIIKNKRDQYEKKYIGKQSRWSGISYYKQAQIVDENKNNGPIPLLDMFRRIYRLNCLNSHNSGIILNKVYKSLNIYQEIDYMYLHNINYIVLLTSLLKEICLPDIFAKDTNIFKEFDTFLGGLKLISEINSNN